MADTKTITVVDVGSTKVVALVGEAADNEAGFIVTGVGIAPARGIRRGQIASMAEAATSLQEALAGAQTTSGVKKAPFVVLIGADIPSVLAELSFMTNKRRICNCSRRRPTARLVGADYLRRIPGSRWS